MMQPPLRVLQHVVSLVELREGAFRAADRIRMLLQRLPAKDFLQRSGIEPGNPRLLEEREIIRHAAKLSPQEQCATALGFVTLNPPFWRSSLKSRSDPLTKSALLGSTTTRTFEDSTMMSRLAGPSTRSILYCNPEHPPPITATRNAPVARPCFSRSEFNFRDAFSVPLMRRSFPIL